MVASIGAERPASISAVLFTRSAIVVESRMP